MTVPQTMRFLSPQRGEEPYFVRNWREFLEAENLTDDPDEALEKNEGWNRLIEEARARIGDYDSDEETILYSLTYQHFAPEMMLINKAYYEILSEGDCTGQPFTFPIPTVNITEDFDWDNPEYDFLFENAARYGSSYFQNFIGSQYLRDENGNLTIRDENAYSPNDLRSMCCRLQLSKKALRKRGGGLFGSDAQTGSIGVVTINMARLGYLYKGDIKGFYKRLTVLMDMARSTLDKKRAFVEEMYLRGLYPYTRRYVKTYDTYFSTIGVNGMNEMVRNFTNDEYDITDERGQKMCMEILDYMNKKMEAYQEDGKALWNLEATPAEGTTTRFAREDIKRYPDIIQAGFPDAPYYTNSSHLPVGFTSDIFDALDIQDELQTLYTSGTVFHAFLGEKLPDWKAAANLVKKIADNYRLPYYSISPTYTVCCNHGYIQGEVYTCPDCGKPLEFNLVETANYNENGYLEKWQKYKLWLQGTVNKKLCVLELGVGMKYPTVIRWPFEKVVYFNQKAELFRVHSKLYQMTEEIKDKGFGICSKPVDFVKELYNKF